MKIGLLFGGILLFETMVFVPHFTSSSQVGAGVALTAPTTIPIQGVEANLYLPIVMKPWSANCAESPDDLVSWWPAEGNADDIQGSNNGSMENGATFEAGMVGQAFSFNGLSRVRAPTTGLPTGNSDRTLDFWVKVNSFFDGEAFFAGYGNFGTLDQTYHLGAAGRTLFFSQWGQAIFGPDLQTDRWYHIAAANVGNTVILYLDGAEVARADLPIDTPPDTQLFIGSLPAESSKRLNGLMDEVDVTGRALSAAEIRAIYSAGHLGKCKPFLP
jgi:hypothetical protein